MHTVTWVQRLYKRVVTERRTGIRVLMALTCLVGGPIVAAAQDPPQAPPARARSIRVEPWAAINTAPAQTGGTLVSSYTPTVPGFESTGEAGQVFALQRPRSIGWEAGVDVYPTRYFGLQVGLSHRSQDLGGVSGPYNLTLRYTSRQPPDYTPQSFTTQWSTKWPDLAGVTRQRTLTINVIAATKRAGPVRASISGGMAVLSVSGEGQSLGFTAFNMGGHSVLFSDEYQLSFAYGPRTVVGWNAGGGVDVAIGSHASVLAGLRYQSAGRVEIPARVVEIVNPTAIIRPLSIESVSAQFGRPTVTIPSGTMRLFFGIRIRS